MKESKIHLHESGINGSQCGLSSRFGNYQFAKKYAEVDCKKCMKTWTYKAYLEGKFKEKPETFEQDCISGYYQTGKMVPWLQKLVDEFNFEDAKALANGWNRKLSGVFDNPAGITGIGLLKFIETIWTLFAINKELKNENRKK